MCISGALACVAVPIYTEEAQKRNVILTIWREEIIPFFFKKKIIFTAFKGNTVYIDSITILAPHKPQIHCVVNKV